MERVVHHTFTSEILSIFVVLYIEDIQMFVKYVFYFTSEVDNIYISWNIIIVHFTSEIKGIFNKKHLNFLFIIYIFPIIF